MTPEYPNDTKQVWGCELMYTTRWNNDVLMLGQRRRRWANIKTLLFQCVVFAGELMHTALQSQKAVTAYFSRIWHLKSIPALKE